jgi:hypothetical protein
LISAISDLVFQAPVNIVPTSSSVPPVTPSISGIGQPSSRISPIPLLLFPSPQPRYNKSYIV